jgi:hypothetical protein
VAGLGRDEWQKDGDFYNAVFSPDTDYVLLKLDTGDQVVVPGVVTDDGVVQAYFQLPRRTVVAQVFAYDKNGKEIAHTPPVNASPKTHLYYLPTWIQAGGGTYDTSVPIVPVASGTSDGTPWLIKVTVGVYGSCFSSRAGTEDYWLQECPDPGVHVQTSAAHLGHPATTFVFGEVDPKTTRVDVTYKDGTVQHLVPTRSNGHAFVGTYVPQSATVVSTKPVTGTNS